MNAAADRTPLRVVFDLDGVIASHDTMAVLIQKQLLGNPLRAIAGALPAAAWGVLKRFPSTRVRMSRTLGSIALSGLTRERYAALADDIGTKLATDPAWSIAAGVAAIKHHIAAGDSVTVTTGTEEVLSRAFLDALGIAGVQLVATTVRFGRAAARYDNHNLGTRKVYNLPLQDIDVFYTDSDLDLPVARLAARCILVNPDARLERLYRAEIEHLEVVRWT